MISMPCPACKTALLFADYKLGQVQTCPKCGDTLMVTRPTPAQNNRVANEVRKPAETVIVGLRIPWDDAMRATLQVCVGLLLIGLVIGGIWAAAMLFTP